MGNHTINRDVNVDEINNKSENPEETQTKLIKVAYLGPPASYTHQAALNSYSDSSTAKAQYELVAQSTIGDVFAAVENRVAEVGIVPFENSTNGCVATTLDLFARGLTPLAPTHSSSSSLRPLSDGASAKSGTTSSISGASVEAFRETYVPVRHCLLGHFPQDSEAQAPQHDAAGAAAATRVINTETDTDEIEILLRNVKTIYTHSQAWSQCDGLLSRIKVLQRAEKIDVSSTSRAAEMAAADTSGSCVAIASKTAAKVYGVPLLLEGIQDRNDNVTRFLALRLASARIHTGAQGGSLTESVPATASSAVAAHGHIEAVKTHQEGEQVEQQDETVVDTGAVERKYLIAFTVPSPRFTQPGALAHSLAVFERHGLSLTSINTRPSGTLAWHYIFFVEAVLGKCSWCGCGCSSSSSGADESAKTGMRERETRETRVGRALRELGAHTETWRLLGSFAASSAS